MFWNCPTFKNLLLITFPYEKNVWLEMGVASKLICYSFFFFFLRITLYVIFTYANRPKFKFDIIFSREGLICSTDTCAETSLKRTTTISSNETVSRYQSHLTT